MDRNDIYKQLIYDKLTSEEQTMSELKELDTLEKIENDFDRLWTNFETNMIINRYNYLELFLIIERLMRVVIKTKKLKPTGKITHFNISLSILHDILHFYTGIFGYNNYITLIDIFQKSNNNNIKFIEKTFQVDFIKKEYIKDFISVLPNIKSKYIDDATEWVFLHTQSFSSIKNIEKYIGDLKLEQMTQRSYGYIFGERHKTAHFIKQDVYGIDSPTFQHVRKLMDKIIDTISKEPLEDPSAPKHNQGNEKRIQP